MQQDAPNQTVLCKQALLQPERLLPSFQIRNRRLYLLQGFLRFFRLGDRRLNILHLFFRFFDFFRDTLNILLDRSGCGGRGGTCGISVGVLPKKIRKGEESPSAPPTDPSRERVREAAFFSAVLVSSLFEEESTFCRTQSASATMRMSNSIPVTSPPDSIGTQHHLSASSSLARSPIDFRILVSAIKFCN